MKSGSSGPCERFCRSVPQPQAWGTAKEFRASEHKANDEEAETEGGGGNRSEIERDETMERGMDFLRRQRRAADLEAAPDAPAETEETGERQEKSDGSEELHWRPTMTRP